MSMAGHPTPTGQGASQNARKQECSVVRLIFLLWGTQAVRQICKSGIAKARFAGQACRRIE
jgi:hypothetical protein